jgi:hypothetical protein
MIIVRTLIVVAASYSKTIAQMDVKNDFLHGVDASLGHVCHLCCALYGLK